MWFDKQECIIRSFIFSGSQRLLQSKDVPVDSRLTINVLFSVVIFVTSNLICDCDKRNYRAELGIGCSGPVHVKNASPRDAFAIPS